MSDQSSPYKQPWEVPNENSVPPVPEVSQQPTNTINQNVQSEPQKQGSPTALDSFLIIASFIGSAIFFVSAPIVLYIISGMLGFDWDEIEFSPFVGSLLFILFSPFTGPLIVGGIVSFFVLRKYISKSSRPNKLSLIIMTGILIILVLFLSFLIFAQIIL